MAAVNFYRFAAAVMEMLEPEKYNFTRNIQNRVVAAEPSEQLINSNLVNESSVNNQVNLSEAATSKDIISLSNSTSPAPESVVLQSLSKTTDVIAQLSENEPVKTSWVETDPAPTALNIAKPEVAAAAKEVVTVQIVTAQLNQAIANASEEKLTQIAQVIKEAAVETAPTLTATSPETSALNQTLTQATNTATTTKAEAASLIQATVQTLAVETTKEIVAAKTLDSPLTATITETINPIISETATQKIDLESTTAVNINQPAVVSFKASSEATAVVTNVITEKLKVKTAENNNVTSIAVATNDSAPLVTNNSATIEKTQDAEPINNIENLEIKSEVLASDVKTTESIKTPEQPFDFWTLFPEIDPSEIKYYDVISYLYDYMKDGSMLDILNPANNLNEKYTLMTFASHGANEKQKFESESIQSMQKSRNEFENKSREKEREVQEQNQIRQQEQKRWEMLQEQKKLAERIAVERLKDLRQ